MTRRPHGGRTLALLGLLLLGGCGARGPAADSPAPPGSSLPGLAAAPGGSLLSWVEATADGHRLMYATLGEDAWSEPAVVAEGRGWFVNWADVPSVVPISGSLWAAHWLVEQGRGSYAYDVAVALSNDAGESWSEPLRPYTDATPTEHGFVSMWPAPQPDGGVGVGLAWLDGRHMLLDPSRGAEDQRTMLRGAVLDAAGQLIAETGIDDRVCDCCPTTVARTAGGAALAYRNRTTDEIRDIHVARWTPQGWQLTGAVAEDGWQIAGCPVNGPALAERNGDLAAAWYTEAGGARQVRVARLDAATDRWTEPVNVAAGTPIGRVDLVWLDPHSVAVSWLEDIGGGAAEVRLARVGVDGHGEPVTVAGTVAGRPAGMPRMLRHGDDLLLAWTHWDDDTPRVRVSRLPASRLPGLP